MKKPVHFRKFARNRRTERQGAGGISKFLFWGEDLSGSFQGAGGVGGLVAHMEKPDSASWAAYYYHPDANGNIAAVTSPFRALAAKFSYDAFGRTTSQSGPKSGIDLHAIHHRFSTKPMELELATANSTLVPPPVSSGLYYYGYRFYSPNMGRWISRDPIREQGGRNLYNFVGNDGVGKIDSYGLLDFDLLAQYASGLIEEQIRQVSESIDAGVGSIKATLENVFSAKWTPAIGENFTETWNYNKSDPIIDTKFFEANIGGGLNVTGTKNDDTCSDCVQVYGTVGITALAKIPLGNPVVNLVVGGNGSLQTTWTKCKNRRTGDYTREWQKLSLVLTPRIGIRVGGSLTENAQMLGEGGAWFSYTKDLLGDSASQISGGWYVTGSISVGRFERKMTLSNGSPNL